MQGARKYARLFETGQYGKLFIESGQHARGLTFNMWIVPDGRVIKDPPYYDKDCVEVYGITSGHPGWTETYGWLHKGAWQEDFYKLVKEKEDALEAQRIKHENAQCVTQELDRQHTEDILSRY